MQDLQSRSFWISAPLCLTVASVFGIAGVAAGMASLMYGVYRDDGGWFLGSTLGILAAVLF